MNKINKSVKYFEFFEKNILKISIKNWQKKTKFLTATMNNPVNNYTNFAHQNQSYYQPNHRTDKENVYHGANIGSVVRNQEYGFYEPLINQSEKKLYTPKQQSYNSKEYM